jgi:hypothetical protein
MQINYICLGPCQWSLMSLITGNKVKKKHTSQGEKEKDNNNNNTLFQKPIQCTLRYQFSPNTSCTLF